MDTPSVIIVGAGLRAPIGCLFWAVAVSVPVWNGYMDGALQSGARAANEVLAVLGSAGA